MATYLCCKVGFSLKKISSKTERKLAFPPKVVTIGCTLIQFLCYNNVHSMGPFVIVAFSKTLLSKGCWQNAFIFHRTSPHRVDIVVTEKMYQCPPYGDYFLTCLGTDFGQKSLFQSIKSALERLWVECFHFPLKNSPQSGHCCNRETVSMSTLWRLLLNRPGN